MARALFAAMTAMIFGRGFRGRSWLLGPMIVRGFFAAPEG